MTKICLSDTSGPPLPCNTGFIGNLFIHSLHGLPTPRARLTSCHSKSFMRGITHSLIHSLPPLSTGPAVLDAGIDCGLSRYAGVFGVSWLDGRMALCEISRVKAAVVVVGSGGEGPLLTKTKSVDNLLGAVSIGLERNIAIERDVDVTQIRHDVREITKKLNADEEMFFPSEPEFVVHDSDQWEWKVVSTLQVRPIAYCFSPNPLSLLFPHTHAHTRTHTHTHTHTN